MKKQTTDVELITPDEPISPDAKMDRNLNLLVRDKQGKFVEGKSGNPNGRPVGTSFGDMITKILEEGSADGITYEDFVRKMIVDAYGGSTLAMRFLLDKTPKPRSQIEVSNATEFELYDLSKESTDYEEDEEE